MTSPPYDQIRKYNGYTFSYKTVISQLYRITEPGGVVVWVVADQVINGSESGSSFKQALYFKEQGFLLHDTMIYDKNTCSFPARRNGNRYTQIFEYMFVFSKGKPKTANLICDKENRWKGSVNWGRKTQRGKDGRLVTTEKIRPVPAFSPRNNVWRYTVGGGFGQKDKTAYKHPATFPLQLAIEHIESWSAPGNVVLDCFVGSGTTCIAAKLLERNYIGVDISPEYCRLARERLENASKELYEEQVQAAKLKLEEKNRLKYEVLQKLTPQEREILGCPALIPLHGLN